MNLTIQDLKEYLNIYFSQDDRLLDLILKASINYVKSYTGLAKEDFSDNDSIKIAILVLAAEMYENRNFIVQNDKTNKVVASILDMYSINLL